MEHSYILSCESTVDMDYSIIASRDIPVLFYSYAVDGVSYPDDMGRDPEALPRFYQFLADGKMPSTSQLNEYSYYDFFRELLERGDVLHIAFGTGMTPSVNNAYKAADKLREEFPERRIIVIDSLCSSSGYGLLVSCAADMRDDGKTMDEVEEWVMAHRERVHHQFFSTDLTYFRRSGRMSGATAMLATVLGICPLMHLNIKGQIIAYSKIRGKKNAVAETVRVMAEHAEGGTDYSGKCYICHSNCLPEAEALRDAVEAKFKNISELRICNIGTIIAAHCGPGTVAAFFIGDNRPND
ncbi:MAG: DegV family protein [Oscillospiraceae bacterium]|nr:DegV family protein [Oscillospiraceae bacterium]